VSVHGFNTDNGTSRPNTREGLRQVVAALGGKIRPAARLLETNHATLIHGLKEDRPPPTLDTMAIYAQRLLPLGIHLCFRYDPMVGMTWRVVKIAPRGKTR
jgi:hypothetical protein